ncbi:unnamed protein product [Rangifer tarandus platyrhynchus]|uniref:Uncharacterized protein n=1 Tax=Rangifer tarandus platyrhynchus TaxID=3082113 RepID=A0AC59YCN2_RANTA
MPPAPLRPAPACGWREASAADAPGASQAFGAPPAPRNPPHLQGNPGPQASAPGRAVHCHNNRAPAAEAAGEEVTSGWLAVVGTRDPGSVLTGQTAEKELGERGGRGAGAPELETAGGRGAGRGAGRAGRPGRQAAEARGPRGSGARRTERGAERRERSEAAPKAGVDGHRGVGLVVSGPHGPLAQPRGPLRTTHCFRRPCASWSLTPEVGV